MATKAVDRTVVDTNVLLAATDEGRSEHSAALAVLNDWPGLGTALYTSGQIMREYLSVATRPADQNGLGIPGEAALSNVGALRTRLTMLDENAKVADALVGLMRDVPCAGKQVHDANIVATMMTHGISAVVTSNTADFRRFDDRVRVLDVRP